MTKSTKKIVTIILIVAISFILIAGIIASVLFIPLQGKKNTYMWSKSDTFNESEHVFTITNEVDTEFNMLQLTDMQLWSNGKDNKATFDLCERLIRVQEPELVLLTGDNVSGVTAPYLLKDLIEFFDTLAVELNFYWAPVFGNHDNEIKATPLWSADQYIKANNKNGRCLFAKGPANLGNDDADMVGNYVINVKENNKIIQSLYMMDSSVYIDNSEEDINAKKAIYDDSKYNVLNENEKAVLSGTGREMYITENQIEWFKWNAENIKALNGGVEVPALSFTHFAMNGVDTAFDEMYLNAKNAVYSGTNEFDIVKDVNGYNNESTYYSLPKEGNEKVWEMTFNANEETDVISGIGSYLYKPATSVKNTEFTTKAKAFGLYGCFFGHDHENDGVLIYDNVIYGYGLKAGPSPKPWNGSKYFGGTSLTINSATPKTLLVEHIVDTNAIYYWNKK